MGLMLLNVVVGGCLFGRMYSIRLSLIEGVSCGIGIFSVYLMFYYDSLL